VKKAIFCSFMLGILMALVLTASVSWPGAKTEAQDGLPKSGVYTVQLDGTIIDTNNERVPIAIAGAFTIEAQGDQRKVTSGSRVLVVGGVGPVPGGTFTCDITNIRTNGRANLVCNVVDAVTGPAGRIDTFEIVTFNNRREMILNLIGGVPGAVVSGTARMQ
jgi:hypothetical protein